MNDREKLVDLIAECRCVHFFPDAIEPFADYLIANGVKIVVRCKDCKYYEPVGFNETLECWNSFWNNEFCPETTPDDFCSYGERRDSDG